MTKGAMLGWNKSPVEMFGTSIREALRVLCGPEFGLTPAPGLVEMLNDALSSISDNPAKASSTLSECLGMCDLVVSADVGMIPCPTIIVRAEIRNAIRYVNLV